ncbi:MAG: hypothetical protein ACR2P5_09760 [Gammaproteobacteria bacterium]
MQRPEKKPAPPILRFHNSEAVNFIPAPPANPLPRRHSCEGRNLFTVCGYKPA